MTRGLKNNNPGNIRLDGVHWKGEVEPSQDRAFKQFETMPWGYRAMFHLLNNYSRLHGCDTIRRMITRWAPENENDTQAYIRAVSEWSGVPADSRITTTKPRRDGPDRGGHVAHGERRRSESRGHCRRVGTLHAEQMKNARTLLVLLALIALFLAGWWLGRRSVGGSVVERTRIDTVFFERPQSVTHSRQLVSVNIPKLLFAPADTVFKTVIAPDGTDSVPVRLPFERRSTVTVPIMPW